MSTVILCHMESPNLDALRASDANIIRYKMTAKLNELKGESEQLEMKNSPNWLFMS